MGGQGNNRVREFYARWSRIEAARRDLEDDAKEIFAEAREEGFRPKTLRAAFREQYAEENTDAKVLTKREEEREEIDLIRAQIASPSHARVRDPDQSSEDVGQLSPHNPETGEIFERGEPRAGDTLPTSAGSSPEAPPTGDEGRKAPAGTAATELHASPASPDGYGGAQVNHADDAVPGDAGLRVPSCNGESSEQARGDGQGRNEPASPSPASATPEPDMPAWMRRTDRGAMAAQGEVA